MAEILPTIYLCYCAFTNTFCYLYYVYPTVYRRGPPTIRHPTELLLSSRAPPDSISEWLCTTRGPAEAAAGDRLARGGGKERSGRYTQTSY